jgi:F-type H+-transporting ATPase subunit gamma
VLATIERVQADEGSLRQVVIVHNRYEQQDVRPGDYRLLPMDEQWLQQLREAPWPTHALPMFTTPADELLSHLVRQYLFVELYGALAESLAAENATRLRAMQSAEKNVEERLDELTTRYNRQRQNSITAELLDVISGSEAVAS